MQPAEIFENEATNAQCISYNLCIVCNGKLKKLEKDILALFTVDARHKGAKFSWVLKKCFHQFFILPSLDFDQFLPYLYIEQ